MKHIYKSYLLRLLLLFVSLISITAEATAQIDSMYVYRTSGDTISYAIEDVDSIVYEKPNMTRVSQTAKAVDLGLSVLWADVNVGSSSPEDAGGYYAWGETEEKQIYDDATYTYYKDGVYQSLGVDIADTEYDVAHVKWGGNWRVPTVDELNELLTKCTWMWTTSPSMNEIHGYLVTVPNGNTMFLPAMGSYIGSELGGKDQVAYLWASTSDTDSRYARALCLYETMCWMSRISRETGVVVRAVCP